MMTWCAAVCRGDAPNDAALHDVFMLDASRAWAVGNLGTILFSEDGGETWRPQTSGTEACLESVHFFNAKQGCVGGGTSRPDGKGGYGILLATQDGGKTWAIVHEGRTGWLHDVWFEDDRKGWLVGEATPAVPTGALYTVNGPQRFRPLHGAPTPGLLDSTFTHFAKGLAVGRSGTIVTLRGVRVANFGSNVTFDGALRGADYGSPTHACLVGDNATVLVTRDGGRDWQTVTVQIDTDLREIIDLRDTCFVDADNVWAAGRGGEYLLHSADGGKTWAVQRVNTPGSNGCLHSVHFIDARTGLAVGDLGRVYKTTDGGATWRAVRNDAARVAVLVVAGGPSRTAWYTLAHLYGSNGWRCALVRASGGDDFSALRTAANGVGCTVVERFDEFPAFPSPNERTTRKAVLDYWSARLDRDAAHSLRRQLVAAIRSLKPAIVIVDSTTFDAGPLAEAAVVAEAALDATRMAADPAAFPELQAIGLTEHKVQRVWEGTPANHTFVAMGRKRDKAKKPPAGTRRVPLLARYWPRLGETSYYAALPALAGTTGSEPAVRPPVALRFLRRDAGAAKAPGLLGGLNLPDTYRRPMPLEAAVLPDATRDRLLAAQRALFAARQVVRSRIGAARVLKLGTETARDHPQSIAGGDALYGLARWHERQGEYDLAAQATREFLTVGKLHPRWAEVAVRRAAEDGSAEHRLRAGHKHIATGEERTRVLKALDEIVRRAPYLARDPSVLFLVAHNHRGLHRFDDCRRFYAQWAEIGPGTDWGQLAATEAWLLGPPNDRPATPPTPMLIASRAGEPMTIDGKVDERAYDRGGDRGLRTPDNKRLPPDQQSRVWVLHDDNYLYVAAELSLDPTVPIPDAPQADRRRDRLDPAAPTFTMLLDIDRDAATAYRVAVDACGNGLDALDDDTTFGIAETPRFKPQDPVLRLAHTNENNIWTIEIALPLPELAFVPPQPGEVWAIQFIFDTGGEASERIVFHPAGNEDATQPHRFGLLAFGK